MDFYNSILLKLSDIDASDQGISDRMAALDVQSVNSMKPADVLEQAVSF